MRITARAGDSFWRYSQWFQLPIDLVVDSNPQIDPGGVMPGQQVDIPGFVATTHRVNAGDTPWTIARSRNVPVEAILAMNPQLDPYGLSVGAQIRVPLRVTWPVVQVTRSYDYAALAGNIGQLTAIYPFVRRTPIGASVMGKEITELRVGTGARRVHANASFHANEWITTPVLMRFLNEYLLALTNSGSIRGLVMQPYYRIATLSAVPMVNPDGVDLVIHGAPAEEPYRSSVIAINRGDTDFSGWKANIRGVDLNNQFPALWEREAAAGPFEPAPRDYPGAAPLTEPEAVAMAELTGERDFSRVLALHTQGEVIYWGFMDLEPPEADRLAAEFARVSGYTPIRTIDSFAGYKDWFIQDWRRPGFTLELGRGVNPLPLAQFEQIYQETLGILLAALYAT